MDLQQTTDSLEYTFTEYGELASSLMASVMGIVAFLLSFDTPFTHTKIELPLFLVGILFFIGGIILALGCNTRKTILHKQAMCQAITKRILTGKTIIQSFSITDIKQVDYLKGYEKAWYFTDKGSEINLIMKNGDRIQVLQKWANKYFNLGINKNLNAEADTIAKFLGVPLNIIDVTTLGKGIQNFNRALESTSRTDQATVLLPKKEDLV